MTEIGQLISSVGFPIVMSIILIMQMRDQNKQHAEETNGFIQAIERNTAAIDKLLIKLDEREDT